MIISSGVGSGLDIASLVQQLVEAERRPTENRLNNQQARASAELSALGQYRGALASLQTVLSDLGDDSIFGAVVAKASSDEHFSVSAAAGAAAGRYEIEVEQLAQAHRLASGAYADSETVVGTGSLTISLAGEAISIDIDAANSSLAGIRDAINAAPDNPGISASLIHVDDGVRLILTGNRTGAEQQIRVTAVGAGLDALSYDPGVLENLSELDAAQDAQILVDDFRASSSSNVFDEVIEGVTLTVKAASAGASDELNVSRNDAAIVAGIEKFVARFNNLASTVTNLTRVDAQGSGSVLTGDAMLRGGSNRLRSLLGREIGEGSINTLAQLGISFDAQARLKIDSEVLSAAVNDDLPAVANFFAGDDGLVTRVDSVIDSLIDSDGLIDNRETGLEASLERIGDRREALDRRIAAVEARYQAQFAALDSLIAQLRSTSDYLGTQLQNLPGPRR